MHILNSSCSDISMHGLHKQESKVAISYKHVIEPAMQWVSELGYGASNGVVSHGKEPGSQQGAREPAMCHKATNGPVREPAMSQGARLRSQQWGCESWSQQWAREPARGQGTSNVPAPEVHMTGLSHSQVKLSSEVTQFSCELKK